MPDQLLCQGSDTRRLMSAPPGRDVAGAPTRPDPEEQR